MAENGKYDLVLFQPPDTRSAQPKMYFPLSLFYLAASVESYKVKILDFRQAIGDIPPARFYGMSVATPQIGIAKELSCRLPGIRIIGGPHPSLLPEDCKGYFDYVVIGEGEDVLPRILEGRYDKGSIIKADRIKNLNSLPLPEWDMVDEAFSESLFPGERYGKGEKGATLIGSRGCPFSCAYCGNMLRVPVTFRNANSIETEVQALMARGIRHFRFEDDNFTLNPDFHNICNMLTRLRVKYKAHTRSDMLTPMQADMMVRSGCEECGLGVESADDNVLSLVNKREPALQHKKAVKILKTAGIRAKTYFMSGLPGETEDTIKINMEFVAECKPDKWTLSVFTPYPGCDIANSPEKYGVQITNQDYSNYWNFPDRFNHRLHNVSEKVLWERYKTFYDWLVKEDWK